MERYASYIGCEVSEVPLSDTAQRIMSALQSIPTGVQSSRNNNQSKEKMKENKLADKDADLKNEKASTLSLGCEEKRELIANIKKAVAFVTTMIFLDGSSQLNSEQHQSLVVNLQKLYSIMMGLARDLQVQGLWKLFCSLELPLIKVLAVMETHKIHVNKQELKKTSEILGVLFEKLKLHKLCEKIPKTERQQVASTSEVVVRSDALEDHRQKTIDNPISPHTLFLVFSWKSFPVLHILSLSEMGREMKCKGLSKLQDLHPLPKIMLEYRQFTLTKLEEYIFFSMYVIILFLGAGGGCYFYLTAGIYLSYMESDRNCDWQAFIQAS
ncbi:hypothetical protein ASZ78_014910, partial [Callipepla squamata]